ncbi:hypothetical protein MBLNU230_g3199t1 [Neophaeotheca triangularis]
MASSERPPEPPKKRPRIPRACANCRSSSVECVYFEKPKDPNVERIEELEDKVRRLSERFDAHATPNGILQGPTNGQTLSPPFTVGSRGLQSTGPSHSESNGSGNVGKFAIFNVRPPLRLDLVSSGRILEIDASLSYAAFFEGCDRFVPVFDPLNDHYDSVRARSSVLFDVIVIYGARARHGVLSKQFQDLQRILRQHTSDLVHGLTRQGNQGLPKEHIQALLVLASYSDCGSVLNDLALRYALETNIPSQLDLAFVQLVDRARLPPQQDSQTFNCARIWYIIYVLDAIFSLDGGKPSSISLQSPARRVRSLLTHKKRTILDLRLFSQVELNAVRSSAHASIPCAGHDEAINDIVRAAVLDLDLWLSEWEGILSSEINPSPEHQVTCVNMRIQHAWAILTLHLRALTASGIANIALMTDAQRSIAHAAKSAAEQHLQLLLTIVPNAAGQPARPYVSNLRYAMEFVWAKNAFCVLIVLRLAILLGDSPNALMVRLTEANDFLRELDEAGVGINISYTRILAHTVKKCERALNASMQSAAAAAAGSADSIESGETDFQAFIPKEFLFEWDFPGLHLCYIPLDWQDLFLDFGSAS